MKKKKEKRIYLDLRGKTKIKKKKIHSNIKEMKVILALILIVMAKILILVTTILVVIMKKF